MFFRSFFFYSFLTLTFLNLLGCSSDDRSPPKSGFELSVTDPVQWDVIEITDRSSGSDLTAYEISGGEFMMKDDHSAIVFLEDHSYTITQYTQNDHGEDSFSLRVEVVPPANIYIIDGKSIPITSGPKWSRESDKKIKISFVNQVEAQQGTDVVDLYPVPGANPLEATYLYDGTGVHTGTYLMRITKNFDKNIPSYDWTMDFSGKDGTGDLVIDLIYQDKFDAKNNIYDIRIENYTLSTGYFDWISGSGFIEENKRSFSLYYRGKIDQ